MKKIFFGAIIFVLCLIFATNVAFAADECCSASECTGNPGDNMHWECKDIPQTDGHNACPSSMGTKGFCASVSDEGGGDPAVVAGGQLKECFKINSEVSKIKVKQEDGSLEETTFARGSYVAPNKGAQCPDSKTADTQCSGTINKGTACYTDDAGVVIMLSTIGNITNWLFYILTFAVTLMIIYGGFILLTGQGDPEKVGKGKGVITFAVIGLAVALVAKIVPSVVKFIIAV